MSHQEQHDWPSFETVLRDVAPDSPAVRLLASADRRAHYAETAAEIRASKSATKPKASTATVIKFEESAPTASTAAPTPSSDDAARSIERDEANLGSTERTRLPGPLEPLELDTSSIRALIGLDPVPTPDASHRALDALLPSPELPVPDLDSPYLDEDYALSLFDDERVADRRQNDDRRVNDGVDDLLDVDADRRVNDVRRVNDDRRIYDDPLYGSPDVDNKPTVESEAGFEAEPPAEVEPELQPAAATELVEELELEFEPASEPEAEPATDFAEEPISPTFDTATDDVAFDTSSAWDSSFGGDLDGSLVFELDNESLAEVDAAETWATPVELEDPFFDTSTSVESDPDVFSATDVPELAKPNSMGLDGSLLDDPFAGVSIDLSPESLDEPNDSAASHTNEPEESLWDLTVDEPEPAVDVDNLDVDNLDVDNLDVDHLVAVPNPEPADTPDADIATSLSLPDGNAEAIELPDASELPDSIELPELSPFGTELLDDLAPLSDAPADVDAINLTDLTSDLSDLSDLSREPEEHLFITPANIDEPKADLFDLVFESNDLDNPDDCVDDNAPVQFHAANFDSVAAAEEIEGHLDSLLDFEDPKVEAELANVIPLRPEVDPEPVSFVEELHDPIDELPEAAEAPQVGGPIRKTRWASIPPEVQSKAPDPWAHMRPVEEPKTKGFWTKRPKFFGGSERQKARAERGQEIEEASETVDDTELGISYDKNCPNCSHECQVDLDDPIGRRVHVSCPSCKHMWHTPYILEEAG